MNDAVSLEINGRLHQIRANSDPTLLAYLRNCAGLSGTKNGCNRGHCGSCTVIVDGKAVRACLVKVSGLDGSRVETIENLSARGTLHPLQEAFMITGAVQCGFCTPGMIMAAKALLDANVHPTAEEIKHALRFNLCRCTGYAAIARAVLHAAAVMRGERPSSPLGSDHAPLVSVMRTDHASPANRDICLHAASSMRKETDIDTKSATQPGLKSAAQYNPKSAGKENDTVEEISAGSSPIKKDALAKATGKPLFADDLTAENMIYGKLLLSVHPSALIKSINRQKALSLPGVLHVLTAADIPGRNGFGLLNPHQPVLASEVVRYSGEAVALVLAESEAAAEAALPQIEVDYELLPGSFSAEEGLAAGARPLHPEGNMIHHVSVRRGDPDKAFAAADIVVEGRYTTPMVEHAYLEPESALAQPEKDGTITVRTASQDSFAFREMIAAALGLAEDKIRVIYTPAGGAFGGKEEPTVQIHCALGALLTGRPVKMTLTREESVRMSTKRHAAAMRYRHAATADGKILAVEAEVLLDGGAYESLSKPVVFRAAITAAGPYEIPHVKTDAYGAYTNHPPAGAFRGFGTTQVAFGAEQQMDRLAEALQMDPFALRRLNGLAPGKKTITGQVVTKDCGYQQCLTAVEEALKDYKKTVPRPRPGKKIGVGVAGAYKNVGLGGGKRDCAGAEIALDREGKLLLKVGAADMGQGSDTALAQVAARETGLDYEDFLVIANDTALTPAGGVTTASRQTYISGNAVLGAAERFNQVFRLGLSAILNRDENCYKAARGGVIIPAENSRFLAYEEIAAAAEKKGITLSGEFVYTAPTTYPLREKADHKEGVPLEQYDIHFAYCYAVQAAVVEVDEVSGEVRVLKVIAAQDLGRAIHPLNSRGQIEGAIVMGMGYGLSEEFVLKNGLATATTLAGLKLPRITAGPEMEIILVEEPSGGPYGAKGMGELPLNPTAPAIISAIYDAAGVRINDLPAKPEKILAAMAEKEKR